MSCSVQETSGHGLHGSLHQLCLPPWCRLHHRRHGLRHSLRRLRRGRHRHRLRRRGHDGGWAAQGRMEAVVALEIIQEVVQMTQALGEIHQFLAQGLWLSRG